MAIDKGNPRQGYQVVNGIFSPKWQTFQEALARILKITFTVISTEGKLLGVHNALPPFSEFEHYPGLADAYSEYFLDLPRLYESAGADRVFFDPLGLLATAMPLDDGNFLLLGGCLDRRDPQRLLDLKGKLAGLGVAENSDIWLNMAVLSREELLDHMSHTRSLFDQVTRSLEETTKLGQRMLVLSAVDEINKLMVGTLNPEHFDLFRILDLVASSLVILPHDGHLGAILHP